LEGESLAPYLGGWEGVATAIDEFLGRGRAFDEILDRTRRIKLLTHFEDL